MSTEFGVHALACSGAGTLKRELQTRVPRLASAQLLLSKLQRSGVNAVTKIRRLWTILKNVAEMRVAATAEDLRSLHE